MSRQRDLGDPRAPIRRFECDACGIVVALKTWESRPDGWTILFPPVGVSLVTPLEYHACSLRHAINLLANLERNRGNRL